MRSDRNTNSAAIITAPSVADWDMRSDRNWAKMPTLSDGSVADWDMRSDRNPDEEQSEIF